MRSEKSFRYIDNSIKRAHCNFWQFKYNTSAHRHLQMSRLWRAKKSREHCKLLSRLPKSSKPPPLPLPLPPPSLQPFQQSSLLQFEPPCQTSNSQEPTLRRHRGIIAIPCWKNGSQIMELEQPENSRMNITFWIRKHHLIKEVLVSNWCQRPPTGTIYCGQVLNQ